MPESSLGRHAERSRGVLGEHESQLGASDLVLLHAAVVGRLTGIDEPVRTLPPTVATTAAVAAEALARLRGKTPRVCRDLVRTALHGHAYDGSKATRELGLSYTPVEETIRRTVDWFRDEGLVERR